MISPFSRMMDYAVDTHFMKDRSGRLVFVPFGLKRSVTSLIRNRMKKKSERLSRCIGVSPS